MRTWLAIAALLLATAAHAGTTQPSGGGTSVTYPISTANGGTGLASPTGYLLYSGSGAATASSMIPAASVSGLGADALLGVGTGLASASSLLSVSYGTAAGTAAQGNDSRIADLAAPTTGGGLNVSAGGIQIAGHTQFIVPSNDQYFSSIGIGLGALSGQTNAMVQFYDNVAIGSGALDGVMTTSATQNTAVGDNALGALTSGTANAAFGYNAGQLLNTGNYNTIFGAFNGDNLTSGSSNDVFGYGAGTKLTNGSYNVIIGTGVAQTTLKTGNDNILIGLGAGIDTPASGTNYYLDIGQTILGTLVGGTSPALGSAVSWAAPQFIGSGSTPTIAAGSAAGTSPTVSVIGTVVAGLISVTTGTSTVPSSTLATITYASALSTAPMGCALTPRNAVTALAGAMIYVGAPGTTTWTIGVGGTALTASTAYSWSYTCF